VVTQQLLERLAVTFAHLLNPFQFNRHLRHNSERDKTGGSYIGRFCGVYVAQAVLSIAVIRGRWTVELSSATFGNTNHYNGITCMLGTRAAARC
jgi:hypothetical protein